MTEGVQPDRSSLQRAQRDEWRAEPVRELEAASVECLSEEGGFLPECVPLDTLREPFKRYVDAVAELPDRYHGATCAARGWLRDTFNEWNRELSSLVDELSVPETEKLMALVSVLCHAYRWDSAPPRPENYRVSRIDLPAGLGEPWQRLAHKLGQPRVGNVYNMVLCNFRLAGRAAGTRYLNHELTNDRLDIAHSWLLPPDRESLAAFVRTGILTEARGASALKTCVALVRAANQRDSSGLAVLLDRFANEVTEMGTGFKINVRNSQMRHGAFLTLIQPTTLWGIDEGFGILEGASGPQIGSIQAVDAVLGVQHDTRMGRAILESRKCMPERHRYFLDLLDRHGGDVRNCVARAGDPIAKARFNACIEIMLAWRRMHVTRAAHYLKGDGVIDVPNYTSTGNVVSLDDQRIAKFQGAMAERMSETTQALVPEPESSEAAALGSALTVTPSE